MGRAALPALPALLLAVGLVAAPLRIVFQLIAPDAGHAEILRLGMGKIEPAHGRGGIHGEILGQRDPGIGFGIEQVEQHRLEAVVGTGGIAGRRADAAIFFLDQRLVGQLLARGIAPQGGMEDRARQTSRHQRRDR